MDKQKIADIIEKLELIKRYTHGVINKAHIDDVIEKINDYFKTNR